MRSVSADCWCRWPCAAWAESSCVGGPGARSRHGSPSGSGSCASQLRGSCTCCTDRPSGGRLSPSCGAPAGWSARVSPSPCARCWRDGVRAWCSRRSSGWVCWSSPRRRCAPQATRSSPRCAPRWRPCGAGCSGSAGSARAERWTPRPTATRPTRPRAGPGRRHRPGPRTRPGTSRKPTTRCSLSMWSRNRSSTSISTRSALRSRRSSWPSVSAPPRRRRCGVCLRCSC